MIFISKTLNNIEDSSQQAAGLALAVAVQFGMKAISNRLI